MGDDNYLGVILDPENSTTIENYYESDYFLNFLENVKIWKENDLICPDPMSNDNAILGNLSNKITYGITGYDYNLENTIYEAEKQDSYDGPIVGTQIGEKYLTTANASTYISLLSARILRQLCAFSMCSTPTPKLLIFS